MLARDPTYITVVGGLEWQRLGDGVSNTICLPSADFAYLYRSVMASSFALALITPIAGGLFCIYVEGKDPLFRKW